MLYMVLLFSCITDSLDCLECLRMLQFYHSVKIHQSSRICEEKKKTQPFFPSIVLRPLRSGICASSVFSRQHSDPNAQ